MLGAICITVLKLEIAVEESGCLAAFCWLLVVDITAAISTGNFLP